MADGKGCSGGGREEYVRSRPLKEVGGIGKIAALEQSNAGSAKLGTKG